MQNTIKFNLPNCGNKNTQNNVGNQALIRQRYRVHTAYMFPRSHSSGDTPKTFTQQERHAQVHTARCPDLFYHSIQPTSRIYTATKLTKQDTTIVTSGYTSNKHLR